MKKKYLGLVLLFVMVFFGCNTTTVTTDEGETLTTTQDGDGFSQTLESEDGQTTTISGIQGADSWCPEGGNWEMNSAGQEGDATATWKVDKLETSGEYAGLCHVIYRTQTPDGEVRMDYWFDESGDNGYYEMEMNGQKIKQVISG